MAGGHLAQALGGCLEDYITVGELALLLSLFWLPIFVLAAVPQWRFLAARRKRFVWLLAALFFEFILSFATWLSPLAHYFSGLAFLGSFSISAIPLQSAILAAVVVTFFTWALGRNGSRSAP